jgi:hypothetical protein
MVVISIIAYVFLLIPLALVCEIYFLTIRFGIFRGDKLRSSSYAVSLYFVPAFLILWLAPRSRRCPAPLVDRPERLTSVKLVEARGDLDISARLRELRLEHNEVGRPSADLPGRNQGAPTGDRGSRTSTA